MSAARSDGRSTLAREADAARAEILLASVAALGEDGIEAVAERVGRAVAEAEPLAERSRFAERFAASLREGRFWPSVPVLANGGRGAGAQLAACFVLEAGDSLESIYDLLGRAARIQQGSGGVGLDLSRLRPRGARIERSGGQSPGPVAFAELAAHSARVNALAGRRAGAHLVVLADSHPDVMEFVASTHRVEELAGAGLALGVSDELLEAARTGAAFSLRDPRGGEAGSVSARELLDAIAEAILETGNPTLLFLDAIAATNPAPHLGPIRATNPCGEQPLLPGESCVLGSLVLPAFADDAGGLDLAALSESARDAVRFLDDVVSVNVFPDAECQAASRRTRKIGLGVMGFADLLLRRGEVYGSEASKRTADEVMSCVAAAAHAASEALGVERGPFPAQRGGRPRRNASLLAVAPTGTLRLLAGCSGGLEPWIAPVVDVEGRAGETYRWIDRTLLAWLESRAADPAAAVAALEAGEPAASIPGLARGDGDLLRRAWEVPATAQLEIQARFQTHVDGAVSKTVHLAHGAEPGEVVALIQRARSLGCKGVAFYRGAPLGAGSCVQCSRPTLP